MRGDGRVRLSSRFLFRAHCAARLKVAAPMSVGELPVPGGLQAFGEATVQEASRTFPR